MTVPQQTPWVQHTANGSTATFAYPFKILSSSDLVVKVNGVTTTGGFTINGVGDENGGSVVWSTNPANGTIITLYRDLDLERETDYQFSGDFTTTAVNADFDKAWMGIQQLQRQLELRALRFTDSESRNETINTLPSPVAGKVLAWQTDGSLANVDINDVADGELTFTGSVQVFTTRAAMIAGFDPSISAIAETMGDQAAYDGGHGKFYYDSGATDTADDYIFSTPTNPGTGRLKLLLTGGVLNVRQAGATGQGGVYTSQIQKVFDYADSQFNPAANPRVGAGEIYFPWGHYKVDGAISCNFGAGEFSNVIITGSSNEGSRIEGTHAGNIFEFASADFPEVTRLSFSGSGCTAIYQTSVTSTTMSRGKITHNKFDANLAVCMRLVPILCAIEFNDCGYIGTAGASHKHILVDAPAGGANPANINLVRWNHFYKAKGDFGIDITSGNGWHFEYNNFEQNDCPPVRLNEVPMARFVGNWHEANDVTLGTGAPTYEIKYDDSATIPGRFLIFEGGNQFGMTLNHTHVVEITSNSSTLDVYVKNNNGNLGNNLLGFTRYNGNYDDGIVDWQNTLILNYTHNDHDVGKYTADAGAVSKSGNSLNVTGNGTTVTLVCNINDQNQLSSYNNSNGNHTARRDGSYRYSGTVTLGGVTGAATEVIFDLVTSNKTYRQKLAPIVGEFSYLVDFPVYMDLSDTARLDVTVNGEASDVVDIMGGTSPQQTFFGWATTNQG